MDTLARIEALIEERHLLSHPFYTKWVAGEIPPTAIREYARRYYHFEAAFPRFLSAIHTRIEDPAHRRIILDNLWDEEHGDENHVELWLRFAEGVGADRADVTSGRPTEATARLAEAYASATSQEPAAGVAAVYAYERQVPAVAGAKVAGLRDHYGVRDARTLAFWRVHEQLDVEHADAERALLERMTRRDPAGAIGATEAALDAWWGFLDEVETDAA